MHLALGNGEFASFKVDDFAAYERQTRRLLAAAIGGDPAAEVYRSRSSTVPSAGGAICALALPEPADGDLFFDIEGARYHSEDGREFGLQYLFGVVDTAEAD